MEQHNVGKIYLESTDMAKKQIVSKLMFLSALKIIKCETYVIYVSKM